MPTPETFCDVIEVLNRENVRYVIVGSVASNIYYQDPRLAPIADNGGPTPTRALEPHSPAINHGQTDLLTDQRGHRRVGPPDIGAYER